MWVSTATEKACGGTRINARETRRPVPATAPQNVRGPSGPVNLRESPTVLRMMWDLLIVQVVGSRIQSHPNGGWLSSTRMKQTQA